MLIVGEARGKRSSLYSAVRPATPKGIGYTLSYATNFVF
jgi:hypothetical protein